MTSSAFDSIAANYDAIWTQSAVGQAQRELVWQWIDPMIRTGSRIIDLGCGTGEDALHMMRMGAKICGIDASPEMVRIARQRGVDVCHMPVETVSALTGIFDGAIANFGVFNCVRELQPVSVALSKLIRPGGFLALCVMGSLCAWETCYFISRGSFRTAVRRWKRDGAASRIGVHVTYPSVCQIRAAFRPAFKLRRWTGIGFCVPPSYIRGISATLIQRFARIDRKIAHWPVLRGFADHRLLLLTRV